MPKKAKHIVTIIKDIAILNVLNTTYGNTLSISDTGMLYPVAALPATSSIIDDTTGSIIDISSSLNIIFILFTPTFINN